MSGNTAMIKKKNFEVKIIFILLLILFTLFLAYPLAVLFIQSFSKQGQFTLDHYIQIIGSKNLGVALKNSMVISGLSATVSTILAFIMAYSIHYTNLKGKYKKAIKGLITLPMLLPTITYGFVIIYSFGKQGLITKLLGKQFFEIYGTNGLLIGYVIYTLPISFMLIYNTMSYIDKKYSIVSRAMGDSHFSTFLGTILRPLVGTLAASFIQCFFLCFTDFGIPASVGGEMQVIASVLYNQMLGSVPDFNNGAVVAMIMMLPSLVSIGILKYLDHYNVRYDKVSQIEISKNKVRDIICGLLSLVIIGSILSIFIVIVIVPFMKGWPYNMEFTMEHVKSVLGDKALVRVYTNSIRVAVMTAIVGTVVSYGAALITARSTMPDKVIAVIESIASITSTIPGMVLGISYMLVFSGTELQNTFLLIILCNVIHFFATPYMMMKNTLSKMNLAWEKTAKLMGDSWIKTLIRVVTPNAFLSLLEVLSYYFINAMVTVSAVIFLAGARTMVITTKIKELQHFSKFNEIFVLSLLILATNLLAKLLLQVCVHKKKK